MLIKELGMYHFAYLDAPAASCEVSVTPHTDSAKKFKGQRDRSRRRCLAPCRSRERSRHLESPSFVIERPHGREDTTMLPSNEQLLHETEISKDSPRIRTSTSGSLVSFLPQGGYAASERRLWRRPIEG
ncbi:unnamed protein product [Diplocarpon coronariae]